ncbi:hypothetical protein E2C01_087440 [Portunus trituberculatus]|uniref:Secreted protein n=1 Tax=Portunus trituberculatus TaxID=210409 RepID=A0A5B7JE19_PORTR|nr:hypothetical protein [Portunus trituberculatus]
MCPTVWRVGILLLSPRWTIAGKQQCYVPRPLVSVARIESSRQEEQNKSRGNTTYSECLIKK